MSTFDDHAILAAVSAYYDKKIADHGPTAEGVDWKENGSHQLRHRQFLRLLEADPQASVLDAGCGYGAFLPFLRAAGHRGPYIGCDVAPGMIEAARRLHGEGPDRRFVVGWASTAVADYAIGSGILNVVRGARADVWEIYVANTIAKLHAAGRRGFGFNMLSLNSDPERRRADLHYADPASVLATCIAQYGRHVALLQDYGLWEFTILMRRDNPATTERRLPQPDEAVSMP